MKILIGTDGSEFSNAAIETSCDLLSRLDEAELKIVAAYEAPAPMAAEPFAMSAEAYQQLADIGEERAKDAARRAETTVRNRLANSKVSVSTKIELGRPAAVIIETAEAWRADLIVVGSHGHGFWGRTMLGSVSDGVIHHAPCSVLVVRKS